MPRRATLAMLLLSALMVVRYHWVLGISFINDDFLYLDHARTLDFWKCWGLPDALGNDYRPIPRNLYFWLGLKLFGANPLPFHVFNLAVGVASAWLLFFVVRRVLARAEPPEAADAPAVFAVLLFSLHPAAGTPLSWVCGSQDLLSVAFALGAVLAHLGRRRVAYLALFVASLLCKKTAVLLPGVLLLHDVWVKREPLAAASKRQLGVAGVLAAWAALDPWLPWNALGRTLYSEHPGLGSLTGHADATSLVVTARALFLAEPFERFTWAHGWVQTELQILLLGIVGWLAAGLRWPRAPMAGAVGLGLAWCAAGILPVAIQSKGYSYYAYYPMLGLSLAVAAAIATWVASAAARRAVPGSIAATGLGGVLLLANGFAWPLQLIDAHAVRRASYYLGALHASLRTVSPPLADSTRCYFWDLPYNVGFQVADGPAVRVWTGNPTLEARFINEYTVSRTRPSRFFRGDSLGVLHEVVRGPEPSPAAGGGAYAEAHTELGAHLYLAGEREAGMDEWRKALGAEVGNGRAAFNLGAALVERGNAAEGVPLVRRAAAAPGPAQGDARAYLRTKGLTP